MGTTQVTAQRWFVVCVEVVYLLILFALALMYVLEPTRSLHAAIGDYFGAMPAGVPWFGALGAVIISLSGAFDHRADWDSSWNLWHFCRPLVGVALAVVAWLILQAGILSIGEKAGQSNNILFYLIAFVVGYREDIFRQLIKKAADVFLTTSNTSTGPSAPIINGVNPATGRTAGNDTVTISGSGLTGTSSIQFGSAPATGVQVVSDSQVTLITPAGVAGPVAIVVVTPAGTASSTFTYV